MAKITSERDYRALLHRIDELVEIVDDATPTTDANYIELDVLSGLVAEYEDEHYAIGRPSLIDAIKLRLYEMGLTQNSLAQMLDISPARVSEIMNNKCEPTLKVGRAISRQLNISPSIVLGVDDLLV